MTRKILLFVICLFGARQARAANHLLMGSRLAEGSLSPGGGSIAFTSLMENPKLGVGNETDVWVSRVNGGVPRRITSGYSGYFFWAPVWSRKGARLAILGMKDGIVRIGIWDQKDARLRLLDGIRVDFENSRPKWISDTRLVCGLLSAEQIEQQEQKARRDLWGIRTGVFSPRVTSEVTTVRTALATPGIDDPLHLPHGQLFLIDAVTGSKTVIVNQQTITGSNTRALAEHDLESEFMNPIGDTSGNRNGVAFLKWEGLATFDPYRPAAWRVNLLDKFSVGEVNEKGEVKKLSTGTLDPAMGTHMFEWSPDHSEFLVVGTKGNRSSSRLIWARYRVENGEAVEMPISGIDVEQPESPDPAGPRVVWTDQNDLAVLGRSVGSKPSGRLDWWWDTNNDGHFECMTCAMTTVPSDIGALPHSREFIGVAGDRVWRFSPEARKPRDVTGTIMGKVVDLEGISDNRAIFVRTVENGRQFLASWTGAQTPPIYLPLPDPDVWVREFLPATEEIVLETNCEHGAGLWVENVASSSILFKLTFPQVAPHDEAHVTRTIKRLDYVTLDGRKAAAKLVLPDFQSSIGKRPLVVVVYPGETIPDDLPAMTVTTSRAVPRPDDLALDNLVYLSAKGYALLYPSQPASMISTSSGPVDELQNGVLPAVDAALGTGEIDEARIGILGQSYGGYAVNALITQTTRFKAAVSIAGASDFVSQYGTVTPQSLVSGRLEMVGPLELESGQANLGVPPWRNSQKYVRNSPIFLADRVQTPLLLITGDRDAVVPMQQSEEFFTALLRESKTAKFISYWAEGHVFSNAADVRDARREVLEWFERFLSESNTSH